MNKRKAAELNGRALKLQEQGRLEKAIALYQQAHALDPGWSDPLYNLGLLFKKQRKWPESLEYNQRATKADPKNEAAWWNLGIAATALGRWRLARSAWKAYGIDVPEGDGPLDLSCGFGPIRLNPEDQGEVVWAYRLDPARACLASIPLPESGHRWKDVVLNDGAPVGFRIYQGQELPVLNALELLEASPFATYIAQVKMSSGRKSMLELAELAADLGGSAEDWSTSLRIICKACSEGRPHSEHDDLAAPKDKVHMIALAARNRKQATQILSTWEKDRKSVQVEGLEVALETDED